MRSARVLALVILLPLVACGSSAVPEGEYLPLLAECLRTKGIDAEIQPDGGMSYDYGTVDRKPAFDAAMAACEGEIGPAPTPRQLTQAEISERYAYLLEMRECLMGLGYTIRDPPSERVFIATWETGPWSPYNDVPGGALGELETQCPQVP